MIARSKHIATAALLVAIIAALTLLCLSRPQVAWNSGAREQLVDELAKIRDAFIRAGETGPSALDCADFVARPAKQLLTVAENEGRGLAERHGVYTRWRVRGSYGQVPFYPCAVVQELEIVSAADTKPAPLIAMVPVEEQDIPTLPNLFGCNHADPQELLKCQLDRMAELFAKYEIEYAAVLLSDGRIRFVPVTEVCRWPRPGK